MPADVPDPQPRVRRWLPLMRELRDAWPEPDERPPLDLWATLIAAESGGDPNAISPQGAVGLGQVMPSDYAGYSPQLRRLFRGRPSSAAPRDPRTNLEWSLRILVGQGWRRCRSWEAALMAYFTGRCHAPDARDATGTSGAQYVARIVAGRAAFADLVRHPPASLERLEARVAALETQAHRHRPVRVDGPASD